MKNKTKFIKTLFFALALAGAGLGLASDKAQAADWYSPDWSYRKAITVDNTLGADALTNYQVLVTLNSGNFDYAKANADGSDLRFASSDGLTEISYWLKEWNAAGDSKIWVKVPTVPALSTTTVYLYYGNVLAVTSLSSFDGTMQKLQTDVSTAALWHFDEGAGTTLADSSANVNNGAMYGFAPDDSEWLADSTSEYGGSGGALNFDGADNYIEVAHDASLNLGADDFTIEGWIRLIATGPNDMGILNKYIEPSATPDDEVDDMGIILYLNHYPNYNFYYTVWDTESLNNYAGIRGEGPIINDGDWHYFAALREETTIKDYIDGEFVGEYCNPALNIIDAETPLIFGQWLWEAYFNGQMDEFRISKRALSAEEIKADYERRQYTAVELTNAIGVEEEDPYDASETIVAVNGGIVTNTADTIAVDIPAGALSADTEITVEASEAVGDFQVQEGITPVDYVYTFGPEGTTFSTPITLTFDYDDTGMTLAEEQSLDIYWFNETTSLWESQGATVDTALNTLTLSVTHFSSYVVGKDLTLLTRLKKIDELLSLVDEYSEQGRIEDFGYSFSVHLKIVQRWVEEGQSNKAIDSLEKFIEKTEKFTPSKIDQGASDDMIFRANEIIGML